MVDIHHARFSCHLVVCSRTFWDNSLPCLSWEVSQCILFRHKWKVGLNFYPWNGSLDCWDPGSISGSGKSPEKGMATHSSILAWIIPWTEVQSTWSKRVRHDGGTNTFTFTWGWEEEILSGSSYPVLSFEKNGTKCENYIRWIHNHGEHFKSSNRDKNLSL